MSSIAIRDYAPNDREGVLAVFRSNTPDYFAPSEEEDLIFTLDQPDGPNWVVTVEGTVQGFGGIEVGQMYNRVTLCWGMIARPFHRGGLGRALLAHRAREAARIAADRLWLVVDTTPEVAGFFRRCGFEEATYWERGYGSGFDMVVLRMRMGSPEFAALVG